jgi:phenylpropionate dioxygenase-like ring-hydroxylating dioxygenase large terminal subunit
VSGIEDHAAPLDRAAREALQPVLNAVLGGAGQSLARAETLPPESYTSPALHALEMRKIFRRFWVPVGHVAQIPAVGDYFTIDVLGELLVVVRGEDRVRVMSRVCLHRWAPVATGAGNTRMFSCPFHRWGYALDGQLKTAPLMERAEGFALQDCRLPEVRSEIVFGTISINLDGTAAPLAERLADAVPVFGRYRMEELVVAYSYERVCAFNWKIAVETFMECYHHIGAHAKSAEPTNPGRLSFGIDGHAGWTACYAPLRPDLPTSEKLKSGLPPLADLPEEVIRNGGLYVIYPVNLITTNADRIHWTTVLPLAPDKCLWIRHVLVRPEARDLPDYQQIIARLQARSLEIFDEDAAVNDMQQLGAGSSGARVGRLSHLEQPVWQFANFVRQTLAE